MPITATPAGRRLAMAVLLLLAVCGAVIRVYADNPSTLRDIGTLLLVLWLPAIGNLVAWLVRKIPRRAPAAAADFQAVFTPHLRAQMQPTETPPGFLASIDPSLRRCTLISRSQGFTARVSQPITEIVSSSSPHPVALELLRPQVALQHLTPGTSFHLLVGTTAVLKGEVVA